VELDEVVDEIRRWGYSAGGFAEHYDRYRPRPPELLLELLPRLAAVERPGLVVDLGSGTGLSTRFWAEHADAVIGVEPNPEMRDVAIAATHAPNVSYRPASAYDTGLPDACAEIVTCSQSLQWMEPGPTFAEVARILRPSGLLAAYEYRWSMTTSPIVNTAFEAVYARKAQLRVELGLDVGKTRWPVTRERFVDSGRFRFVDETRVHSVEEITAERLVGFSLSEGSMTTLLAAGVTEEAVGLTRLREVAQSELGDEPSPWYLGYRVVVGQP
jgi:SAM-dependent methyltransferase